MPIPNQRALVTWWFAENASFKEWSAPFHFELVGTFGSTYDIAAAGLAVEGHFQSKWLDTISSDTLYLGMDARINNNGVSGDASVVMTVSGNAASGAAPTEVAAVVHWQSASPGGRGRGRSYLTGMPTTFISGGRVTSAYKTVIDALATSLKTPFVDQGISWQLRLYSRSDSIYRPMASFVTDSLLGTQRKRRPRR